MTGKLEEFRAISTNTLTNKFCHDNYVRGKKRNEEAGEVVDICGVCYSHEMLRGFRKNTAPALQRNSDLFPVRVLEQHELPIIMELYYRFDAHGELITETVDGIKYPKFTHIENYCRIAEHNPHCSFALWTKRTDIIGPFFDQRAKPANLILIYSNKKVGTIMSKPPRHFDRTFNNVLVHEYVELQNCTGQKCKDCLLCYTPNNGVDTIVEKVKRY
jgi:hypothetical protein